jgi:hypothetical protein
VGGVKRKYRNLPFGTLKRLADMTTVQKIKEIEDEMVINIMFWNLGIDGTSRPGVSDLDSSGISFI